MEEGPEGGPEGDPERPRTFRISAQRLPVIRVISFNTGLETPPSVLLEIIPGAGESVAKPGIESAIGRHEFVNKGEVPATEGPRPWLWNPHHDTGGVFGLQGRPSPEALQEAKKSKRDHMDNKRRSLRALSVVQHRASPGPELATRPWLLCSLGNSKHAIGSMDTHCPGQRGCSYSCHRGRRRQVHGNDAREEEVTVDSHDHDHHL